MRNVLDLSPKLLSLWGSLHRYTRQYSPNLGLNLIFLPFHNEMGFSEVSDLHRSPDLFYSNRGCLQYWSRPKPAGHGSVCFPPDLNFEAILHEEGRQGGAKEGYDCRGLDGNILHSLACLFIKTFYVR